MNRRFIPSPSPLSSPSLTAVARPLAARRRLVRGFSLVELMVAMTIGLLIVVGLTAMYVASSSGKKTDSRYAEFQTNARYAIDMVKRDIQQAGYAAFNVLDVNQGTAAALDIGGCGANFVVRLEQPVYGTNNSNGVACIAAANYKANSDVLVMRRAGPECIGASSPCVTGGDANKLYMRTGFAGATVYQGTAPAASSFGPMTPEDLELHTDIYYLRPCTSTGTCESPAVPALFRKSLDSGPAMNDTLVAGNIDDFQVQYGVLSGGSVRYLNANDVGSSQWAQITSIRLFILARSTDKDPGFTGTQTFTYADRGTVTFDDGFQRQLFQQVIQVRQSRDGVIASG